MAHNDGQEKLMLEIIELMIRLDFPHLVILNFNISEHIFNVIQHNEMERLRLSEATDENNSDSQPLPKKGVH